jgi:hypothetical protein
VFTAFCPNIGRIEKSTRQILPDESIPWNAFPKSCRIRLEDVKKRRNFPRFLPITHVKGIVDDAEYSSSNDSSGWRKRLLLLAASKRGPLSLFRAPFSILLQHGERIRHRCSLRFFSQIIRFASIFQFFSIPSSSAPDASPIGQRATNENRRTFIDAQALQILIAGFPHRPDYSPLMMKGITSLAEQLNEGDKDLCSLRGLIVAAASLRAHVEKSIGQTTPPEFFVLRSEAPAPCFDFMMTPINRRFRCFADEARHLLDSRGALRGAHHALKRTRRIASGETVELTGIRGRVSDGTLDWTHPDVRSAEQIIDHCEPLYRHVLNRGSSPETSLGLIAEIHWWIANAQPLCRGTASISDAIAKTLMIHAGLPVPRWREGLAPDIKAFHLDLEEYVALYPHFFERNPLAHGRTCPRLSVNTHSTPPLPVSQAANISSEFFTSRISPLHALPWSLHASFSAYVGLRCV